MIAGRILRLAPFFLAGGAALARADGPLARDSQGVTLRTATGFTRVEFWGPHTVRVVHGPADRPPAGSLTVVSRPAPVAWRLLEDGPELDLTTADLVVRVRRATGEVGFFNLQDRPILAEAPTAVNATPGRLRQSFALAADEGIFGLGQHQDGVMDYVGTRVHLQQENREVAVPVLLSSKGYALLWDNPSITDVDVGRSRRDRMVWVSEAGQAVDYYFFYGPKPDRAIAAYRELTGAAPLFPEWAWGFWQCRERYHSQEELLGVVREYRRRGVPLDGIIQDWQYWGPHGWGSHAFDPRRYPNPEDMIREVHRAHAHIIISVWPKFDLGTEHLAELKRAGAVYAPVFPSVYPPGRNMWYDPFSPEGRRIYWRQLAQSLFARGIDGWWLDASEPELGGHWGEFRSIATAAGPGARVFNAYPLMHTTAVYQGQRAESGAKRVFILTRSAYAGQQRNAAVTWSGDIQGTWDVFRRQIPAGLNFVASGIPYWNSDTGGFFGGDPRDPKYAELFTRWFQFSAFCPMFRVHGTGKPKEIWRFDEATQHILADTIRLRYRLLPYIYSLSWQVTSAGDTLMRPLVMDFPLDSRAYGIADEYLFGPALLVCPVTRPGATRRSVYLPAGATWTDFWSGRAYPGGETIETEAPLGILPLFVRAGAIIPCGPDIQYAGEKPGSPLELRIGRGANGVFDLYEDEGDGYAYEKGAYAVIPIRWDDNRRMLTIGERRGSFPGMIEKRVFRVARISPGTACGPDLVAAPEAEVSYDGRAVSVRLPDR